MLLRLAVDLAEAVMDNPNMKAEDGANVLLDGLVKTRVGSSVKSPAQLMTRPGDRETLGDRIVRWGIEHTHTHTVRPYYRHMLGPERVRSLASLPLSLSHMHTTALSSRPQATCETTSDRGKRICGASRAAHRPVTRPSSSADARSRARRCSPRAWTATNVSSSRCSRTRLRRSERSAAVCTSSPSGRPFQGR